MILASYPGLATLGRSRREPGQAGRAHGRGSTKVYYLGCKREGDGALGGSCGLYRGWGESGKCRFRPLMLYQVTALKGHANDGRRLPHWRRRELNLRLGD
jgi:hypothetical protein